LIPRKSPAPAFGIASERGIRAAGIPERGDLAWFRDCVRIDRSDWDYRR
jgi:hypothetical protein